MRKIIAGATVALVLGVWLGMAIEVSRHRPLTPFWKENPALIRAVCNDPEFNRP